MFLGPGWRSSTVEQLICNQQVVGSSPIASSMQKNCLGGGITTERRSLVGSAGQGTVRRGEVPEWPKGADCKSAGYAFEGSNPSLSTILVCGNSSVGRARAFQARGRGFESRFPLQFAYDCDGETGWPDCFIFGQLSRYPISHRLVCPGSSVGRARPW